MRSLAQALVTWVKARLSTSRFPKDPELSSFATSASVERAGSVSFFGPPFCCCTLENWTVFSELVAQILKNLKDISKLSRLRLDL